MSSSRSIDDVPVVFTPSGGWTDWPDPVLAECIEQLPRDAPDLRGLWKVVEARVGNEIVADHSMLGSVSRIEQAGNRIVITSGGVIHDMRCDGTLDNGVHDVAAADFTTEVHVVASYEDGVHVLRPDGLPIEVRRWREGEHLVWDYLGTLARLQRIGDTDVTPADLDEME